MSLIDLLLAGDQTSPALDEALDAAGPDDVATVLALATHPDPRARAAAATALPYLAREDPPGDVVATVITLSTDEDPTVRDAACFALAQQWRGIDSPALGDALAARLADPHDDTRCEALLGLSYRRDPRALPALRAALSRPDGTLWRLELVAAGTWSEPDLHDLVLAHQTGWDDADAATADAARRLTDPDGPGDDLLDGVADLYRRRAYNHSDTEALTAWTTMALLLDIAPHRAREFLDAVLARLDGDDAALEEACTRSALAQLAQDMDTAHAPRTP